MRKISAVAVALCLLLAITGAIAVPHQSPFHVASDAQASDGANVATFRKHNDTQDSFNLIDLVAQSSQHSIFLRLLQRTRLIPTLNRLQEFDDGTGLTMLAPTDDAFLTKKDVERQALAQTESSGGIGFWEYLLSPDNVSSAAEGPVWHQNRLIAKDNINAVARQHLLYHILNYTLPFSVSSDTGSHSPAASLPEQGKPQLHITMHFPSRRMLTEPTHPGRIPVPDEEDHGGLLGDEGQRLRIAARAFGECRPFDASRMVNAELAFGTEVDGSGGATSLSEDWRSKNGVLHSIDAVLDLPPPLEHILNRHPSLTSLLELLDAKTIHTLSTVPHLTLFLPSSDAFSKLTFLERAYLFGPFRKAVQDRLKLLGWHMSGLGLGDRRPVYATNIREAHQASLTTTLGGSIDVKADAEDGHITVLQATVQQEDILTENGVVHIVDELVLPFGDLDMSIEKHLLALNASKFVDLVYSAGLEHYINRPAHHQSDGMEPFTFLAPRDDVIETWLQMSSVSGMKAPKGPTLEEVVRYHILPGLIRPTDLEDGMLLGTELSNWKLRQGRQRMPVQVDDTMTSSDRKGNGDVGFGDANVLRDAVEVDGRAMIYIISHLLQPPSDPVQTAVSFLALSTFVATIFSADLTSPVQKAPGITYLVPTNDAFTGLGLAMNYLLLPDSQPLLQALVEYHAVDKIAYMSDFAASETRYPTLLSYLGADVVIKREKGGTVSVRKPGQPEGIRANIVKGDILTNTGVIHEIDRVHIPFDLTIRDLLKGVKADAMEDLMTQAGYEHILDSTYSNSTTDNSAANYVVLVPTDSAFTRVNLSAILESPETLKRLVQQHIIPLGGSTALADLLPDGKRDDLDLKDESSFGTLLDKLNGGPSRYGSISFRKVQPVQSDRLSPRPKYRVADSDLPSEDGLGWMVGIKDTRGSSSGQHHSARIFAFGREARALRQYGSLIRPDIGGVLQIDAVLMPYEPTWFYRCMYEVNI